MNADQDIDETSGSAVISQGGDRLEPAAVVLIRCYVVASLLIILLVGLSTWP